MENKNLEKKGNTSIWKLILKIIFILITIALIVWWAGAALCWWIFLFDSWGRWIAIWALLWWILTIILWIYFSKNINKILKKIFKDEQNNVSEKDKKEL